MFAEFRHKPIDLALLFQQFSLFVYSAANVANVIQLRFNVVYLRVNDIDNVCLYTTIAAFMLALKPAFNMRQFLILPLPRAPPLSLRGFSTSHPLGEVR